MAKLFDFSGFLNGMGWLTALAAVAFTTGCCVSTPFGPPGPTAQPASFLYPAHLTPDTPPPGTSSPMPPAGPAPAPSATPPAPPFGSKWNPILDLGAVYWTPWVYGNIKANKPMRGSKLDFVDELDLSRWWDVGYYRAKGYLGKGWNIGVDLLRIDETGRDHVEGNWKWQDTTLPAGYDFRSKFEMDQFTISLGREFYYDQGTYFGLTGGMLILDVESSIKAQAQPSDPPDHVNVDDDYTAWAPRLGLSYWYQAPKHWRFGFDAGGGCYYDADDKVIHADTELSMSYFFTDNFFAHAGYRFAFINSDWNDSELFYLIHGPMVGLWFRF